MLHGINVFASASFYSGGLQETKWGDVEPQPGYGRVSHIGTDAGVYDTYI